MKGVCYPNAPQKERNIKIYEEFVEMNKDWKEGRKFFGYTSIGRKYGISPTRVNEIVHRILKIKQYSPFKGV